MRTSIFHMVFASLISLLLGLCTASVPPSSPPCNSYPAIFTFGDSTVDVGTNNYLPDSPYKANFYPYGIDYISSSGRFSNGKLVGDFIAEALQLSSAPPFLQPSSNRTFGVNFASAASGVLNTSFCENNTLCISLSEQIGQFASIKDQYEQKFLSESLFLLSSGSNDYLSFALNNNSMDIVSFLSSVVNGLISSTKNLYDLGARNIVVFDVPALGCLPAALAAFNVSESSPECVEYANIVTGTHRNVLTRELGILSSINDQLHITVGNVFEFLLEFTSPNDTKYGFNNTFEACCGAGPFYGFLFCGQPGSTMCAKRSEYFFWDPVHPTEAGYEILAQAILYGSSEFVSPEGILGPSGCT